MHRRVETPVFVGHSSAIFVYVGSGLSGMGLRNGYADGGDREASLMRSIEMRINMGSVAADTLE